MPRSIDQTGLAIVLTAGLIAAVLSFQEPALPVVPLHSIVSDLRVPETRDDVPAPGRRVRQRLPEFTGSKVYHVLYLPEDWTRDRRWPVICEYPGNGGFKNTLGDTSSGLMEDCRLGYGISAGRGVIWVCLPFVDTQTRSHALHWWGDPEATARYCRETVDLVRRDFGGDPRKVLLAGFSRGSIACGYIGLRDAETARLWRGFIAHSHYDGVRAWPYPQSDPQSAAERLARRGSRPQFVSHEQSVNDVRSFLKSRELDGATTFVALPYPNHSADWVLKDIPERRQLRDWVRRVLMSP